VITATRFYRADAAGRVQDGLVERVGGSAVAGISRCAGQGRRDGLEHFKGEEFGGGGAGGQRRQRAL
jgi:hypothetical protein